MKVNESTLVMANLALKRAKLNTKNSAEAKITEAALKAVQKELKRK